MDRLHKRFVAFLVSMVCIEAGFLFGPIEIFAAFAGSVTVLYGAYAAGQSSTDHRAISINAPQTGS